MYSDRGIIVTFTELLLWCFMPPCSKGLAGSYMWSYLTEYRVLSGQLCIITYCIYTLKLDVPGQYTCC